MAFGDFTMGKLKRELGLVIDEDAELFSPAPEAEIPSVLQDHLDEFVPLATKIGTEKARSELIIGPVLYRLKSLYKTRLTVFSGVEFNIDDAKGLRGRCDFLLARGLSQFEVESPVCVLVEAKKEDIGAGVPQCLAEMVAAQQFNAEQATPSDPMYGVVSTGELWKFLRLDGSAASVDRHSYSLTELRQIFGILTRIALGPSL